MEQTKTDGTVVVGWDKWDEKWIDEKGEVDSLSEIVQYYMRWFIELPLISGFILGCVILMSLFIFVDIVRFSFMVGVG